MSNTQQRNQWAEHMQDEAKARALQQESAGPTHLPAEGPIPHTARDLAAAVAAAVHAERQRCADIAEAWSSEAKLLAALGELTERELRAAISTAHAVGADIRRA